MNRDELEIKLQEFRRDPVAAMNRLPEKRDSTGRVLPEVRSFFEADGIEDGSFVTKKDTVRNTLHTLINGKTISIEDHLRAPIEEHDRPENLVDVFHYSKLEDIDQAGLHRAALGETPWSDDYWPIYRGMLGCRYSDPKFPERDGDWQENFEYIRRHPVHEIVGSADSAALDQLSPSEKYDLLVGDASGTLTAAMWSTGRAYLERTGTVERWMGVCHGWAPASYMLPRPRSVVTTVAADGSPLRFYPSDIKALASLLWANAAPAVRFIGSRATAKDPAVDEVGRVMSSNVFDTNPGTWHLAIVNQLAGKRSFVMDAQYDYEVWNQPVTSYEYTYFNEQEEHSAKDLKDAMVTREEFTNDKFTKYRSPDMVAVVGVAMRVGYVVETTPAHAATDGPSNDTVHFVDYLYDVELDPHGRIIGGEWLHKAHPDFLWTPPPEARAVTSADEHATGSWSPSEPVPDRWRQAALLASNYQQPLARIVENLIAAANS